MRRMERNFTCLTYKIISLVRSVYWLINAYNEIKLLHFLKIIQFSKQIFNHLSTHVVHIEDRKYVLTSQTAPPAP